MLASAERGSGKLGLPAADWYGRQGIPIVMKGDGARRRSLKRRRKPGDKGDELIKAARIGGGAQCSRSRITKAPGDVEKYAHSIPLSHCQVRLTITVQVCNGAGKHVGTTAFLPLGIDFRWLKGSVSIPQ